MYLSKLAESKLTKLTEYLLEKWGLKVKKDFLVKFTHKVDQIASQPESCPKSKQLKGIYKCVVTKQTTFYYRILLEVKEIEIITIFDTRQHPDQHKKQLR